MSRPVSLVTGAAGEMGHLLVPALRDRGYDVVALDLGSLPSVVSSACVDVVRADVTDETVMSAVFERHRPELVFHLAAVLSSKAELDPDKADRVNAGGSVLMMRKSREIADRLGRSVRFMFPSSIAVYGFPDRETKDREDAVAEDHWLHPRSVYGCSKLYVELLGGYHAARARAREEPGLDFRAIRFPGLLSAATVPTGGTSDYGPEMFHAAARGESYACFVRESTRLPFMTMPDAVDAFLRLSSVDPDRLSRRAYNIRAFAPSAADFKRAIERHFPNADVSFESVPSRQQIVDSWPADVSDGRARDDWGFAPRDGFESAVERYLMPALRERYAL